MWILAALVAVTAAACSAGGESLAARGGPATGGGREGGGQPPPVPVTAAVAVQKSMPIDITVVGTAEAYSSVAVHAQITGELTSVNFKDGEDVAKGRELFTLDRRPLEAALQQATANLE